jgi:hypothetical protein
MDSEPDLPHARSGNKSLHGSSMVRSFDHATTKKMAAAIHTLNQRWARRALTHWQGGVPDNSPEDVYAGFDDILQPGSITAANAIGDTRTRNRIRHGLIDHYLQRRLMPHETEMHAWSRGAAALVDGEKIYLRDIIPWCQKASTMAKRQKLQAETGPLCKFLKPFALNYWELVIDTLTKTLGFDGYIDYCQQKKGIDYFKLYKMVKQLIDSTDRFYFEAMDTWSRDRFRRPLERLTRFDAMYLLSLSQWDAVYPKVPVEATLGFFSNWQIDPQRLPGLHLDLRPASGKSAQAITMMVRIPDEIHLLMRPIGGWIDVESLWHELGHGMSAAFCDKRLPLVLRELATDFSLSEVYAFLLQRLALSRPVLESVMGLSEKAIETIVHYRQLKDLSVFRRYAAKFICEYDMFTSGRIADGHPYADTMARVTGFYHQPESHLFDLVPEFYCADYLLGWIGEAQLEAYLRRRWGETWCLAHNCGPFLKSLWRQGNQSDIFSFFEDNALGRLSPAALSARWREMDKRPPGGCA